MAIFLSKIDEAVQEELRRREKYLNYENSDSADFIKWHSKTPWLKLFSNARTGKPKSIYTNQGHIAATTDMIYKNDELARKYILVGSTLDENKQHRAGFEELYTDLEEGEGKIPFRPLPIITEANVKTVGKLGSLRKANINFECYTLEQLEEMETIYMTPGASCVLQ